MHTSIHSWDALEETFVGALLKATYLSTYNYIDYIYFGKEMR